MQQHPEADRKAPPVRRRDSDDRLRRGVEASATGIWELDLITGRVTADARHLGLLGLPPGCPLTFRMALRTIHAQDRQRVVSVIADTIRSDGDDHFVVEYRTLRIGSTERWVEGRGQLLRDVCGRPWRLVGTSVDITQRKAAEARHARHNVLDAQIGLALAHSTSEPRMLQECAEAIVSLLDVTLARIWLLNPKDNVLELQASAGLYTHLGGEHSRIPVGAFKLGLLAEAKVVPVSAQESGAEAWVGNMEWARREGIGAFAAYPLLLGDMLVGVMALYSRQALPRDTTDILKQATGRMALGVKRLRAESELRARADFEKHLLGIVSHDLRNPLNAILLSASALARWETLDPLAVKTAMRIQTSAERAARMIRDLLDFTQARLGGGIRITRSPLDLRDVVRGVIEEVQAAHPGREVRVRLDGENHGEWDGDRIAQVVQNLVTNAIKYSPIDTPVHVSVWTEAGWALLSVHNQGAPIPPEKLPCIFEPLLRGTAEVDHTGRSIGLGLYIVKQIAEAHAGRVEVRSTEAEGTSFTVLLPR